MRRLLLILVAAASVSAQAQFVWPKPEYNRPVPGTYVEDPFIIEYRKKFFAVFRGDTKTFEQATREIDAMLEKNPRDARAMVWKGNGQTVRAGLLFRFQNKPEEAYKLLDESRKTLDKAVALSPKDPNIYMMRAATLYIQGQYFPNDRLPRKVWETLRDDCLQFIDFIGPERMPKTSIHLRGEAYGSLGVAYLRLGDRAKARAAFQKVAEMNPGTAYEERAKREIAQIDAKR